MNYLFLPLYPMNLKSIKYIAPILLIIGLIIVFFLKKENPKPITILPFYGPKTYSAKKDTVYHSIMAFSFTDQYGRDITNNTVDGKIYVADYFFTTCKSICPIMSTQMERVQEAFKNESRVVILSHTVDPEEDSVSVLMDYATKHKAIKDKWYFLTGNKPALYEQARKSYLLDAEEGNGGEEDFIHADKFALIDWNKRIRGYYVGTDSAEVAKLIVDIKTLIREKEYLESK